jgi:hypothetical protein
MTAKLNATFLAALGYRKMICDIYYNPLAWGDLALLPNGQLRLRS